MSTKPLFIPLKAEYFEAFVDGSKTEELRMYGPRWNEDTCSPGREVVISKGYGKHARLKGRIWRFKRQHGSLFGSTYKAAIEQVYGTLDVDIACISITDLEPQGLLPCPFCGQQVSAKHMPEDATLPFGKGYWFIDHGTDGTDDEGECKVSFTVMQDLDKLVSAWNTRR